jgi:hypothetical protein
LCRARNLVQRSADISAAVHREVELKIRAAPADNLSDGFRLDRPRTTRTMSDTRPSAQLIPIGEVQRLVGERRRRTRPPGLSEPSGSFSAPRSTSHVRRLLTERPSDPSGPEAA